MTTTDPYVLGRATPETARLNNQHALWTTVVGGLFPPALCNLPSTLPPNARIADIGTGTGIWLRDLAATSPPTHQFIGYDISPAQFIPAADLPPNVSLQIADFTEPWPQQARGTFDIVNIRLIVIALGHDSVWRSVLRNVLTLLKPGGTLVWTEGDFLAARGFRGLDTASTPGAHLTAAQRQFNASLVSRFGYSFPERFASLLEDAGMLDVGEDVVSTDRDPDLRRAFTELGVGAVLGGLANLAREGGAGGEGVWGEEEVERRREAAVADMESGAYLRWNIHVVWGKRVGA